MNKSVYSVVLTDAVVAEIDRLARETGTSRSNVVNQILAEYVSYTTPEKRMREVFGRVEQLLVGDAFERLLQPSDAMFSLRSALSYKYNPTVRYSVELYRDNYPLLGELRVTVRSQNSTLMLAMLQFFKLWAKVEQSYIGHTEHAIEAGRYVRKLRLETGAASADAIMTNEAVGEAIAGYIDTFDRALKTYFEFLNNPHVAVTAVERLYAQFVRESHCML